MTNKNLHLIDLYTIPQRCLPMVVVSAGDSIVSKAIRWWTHGNYSHVMWLWRPGFFASQDLLGYREVPVSKYADGHKLRLFYFPGWNENIRKSLLHRIGTRIVLPWHRRRYDVVGIAGHVLGHVDIHLSSRDYCVESVVEDLHSVNKCMNIKQQCHPQDVADALLEMHSAVVYGDYDVDKLTKGFK